MIRLISCRGLGSGLLDPSQHNIHRPQLPKPVIREYDGKDTPEWHPSDPIEQCPALDLTLELKPMICNAAALPTDRISCAGGSGLSECDTNSIAESNQDTASYWRHVGLAGSFSRLDEIRVRDRGLQDLQQWLDNVEGELFQCAMDASQQGTSSAIACEESRQVAAQCAPTKAFSKRLHEPTRSEKDGDESDSSGGIRHPKRHRSLVETNSRFACPFFKHNPHRYMGNRTCAGPGWTTTHRVK